MIVTIRTGRIFSQGTFLKVLSDGRVTITAHGRTHIGWPV